MMRSRGLVLAVCLFVAAAAMFAASVVACLDVHAAGGRCFAVLDPAVLLMQEWYRFPQAQRGLFFYRLFGCVAISIGLLLVSSLLFRKMRAARVFLCLLVAVGVEFYIVREELSIAVPMLLLAPLILAVLLYGLPATFDGEPRTSKPLSGWEVLGLLACVACLLCTQFYNLNYVPAGWDTEFCPFRYVYWTSWDKLLLHETGHNPQTSCGLAWNFLMKSIGHQDEPELYYLYIRFLGSGIALVKTLLVFFFVRYLSGTFPAFLAAVLLGFGPPENWWSREPFLHSVPGLVGILLLWSCVYAWRKRSWLSFVFVPIAMILTRFVYPSGLFLCLVPVCFFFPLLFLRWREWRPHAAKLSLILFGLLFWLGWRSLAQGLYWGKWELLSPFLVPHEHVSSGLWPFVEKLWGNFLEVLTSVFLYQVNLTHWTVPLGLPPWRVVTSVVVVLLLVAIGRILTGRVRAVTVLLLLAAAWACVPSLSTQAAARRMGAVFMILIVIAANEAGYIFRVLSGDGFRRLTTAIKLFLPIVVGGYLLWICSAHHFQMSASLPSQVLRGRLLRQEVRDDSLIVLFGIVSDCDAFYSIYQDLQNRECRVGLSIIESPQGAEVQKIIDAPGIDPSAWEYRLTNLGLCVPQQSGKVWSRVVFITPDSESAGRLADRLAIRYPGVKVLAKAIGNNVTGRASIHVIEVEPAQTSKAISDRS